MVTRIALLSWSCMTHNSVFVLYSRGGPARNSNQGTQVYEVRASACFEKVVVVGKTVFNSVWAWMTRRSNVLFDNNDFSKVSKHAEALTSYLRSLARVSRGATATI